MKTEKSSTNVYIWGAIVGMGVGLISAHMFRRAAEENIVEGDSETALSAQDMFSLGMILFGVVRQIAEAGSKTTQKD